MYIGVVLTLQAQIRELVPVNKFFRGVNRLFSTYLAGADQGAGTHARLAAVADIRRALASGGGHTFPRLPVEVQCLAGKERCRGVHRLFGGCS